MKTIELENDNTKYFFNDRYVWILLIISLSVRIYLNSFTYVIKNDSVAFMSCARFFADGDFLSGLRHDYHPLYSFLMAVMYKVIPDMEISGTIVSVSFGTLTVIVFYLIGKSVFDRRISFVSSVILALHPYAVRFSVDIISESTYFFFFISALGLGFFAIAKRKYYLFALTGICAALTYLARPEGIGIIFIVAGWCILKDLTRFKIVWKEKLVSVLILATSFLVFSMPYLVYIKKETGSWRLTKKKDLSQITGVDAVLKSVSSRNLKKETGDKHAKKRNVSQDAKTGAKLNNQGSNKLTSSKNMKKETGDRHVIKKDVSREVKAGAKLNKQGSNKSTTSSGRKTTKQKVHSRIDLKKLKRHINSILFVLEKYLTTFHPFLFLFLIIGVINWTRIKKVQYFGFYMTSIIVFYLLVLYRLHLTFAPAYQYPSRRHLIPLVIPAIFCVGIGVYATGSWVHKKFQFDKLKSGLRGRLRNVWIAQLLILMIIVSVLLPKTLKPQRFDKLGIKKAGQWIREHSYKPSPAILSASVRNAYYAGGTHVQMEHISSALSNARAKKVDYILITHREYMVIEKQLQQSIKDKKITLACKFPEGNSLNKRIVLLYKVLH
jgi:4-amino-4-deoxy-L-arabinose transferase-like glycosyltransferase